MRAPLSLAAGLAMLILGTSGVLADPEYRASDIVAHFAPAPKRGITRSLCVGTETECGRKVADQPRPVDSFDLRVTFQYGSANLTTAAKANLDEFARALKDPKLEGSQFVVEGHTDGIGGDVYNLDLSRRRANSVVSFLAGRGVDALRLEARGYGKQRPLVDDPRAGENRRVETRLRAP